MSEINISHRYSDEELAEFKALIERKIEKTSKEIADMEDQISNLNESLEGASFDLDDNQAFGEVDFLNTMVGRQKKHLNDLQNALVRINNKSYGICVLTGKKIDKRRLMAVPTTTKSLQAKIQSANPNKKVRSMAASPKSKDTKPKIISKVVRKPGSGPVPEKKLDLDEDFNLLLPEEEELDLDPAEENDIDFDQLTDSDVLNN